MGAPVPAGGTVTRSREIDNVEFGLTGAESPNPLVALTYPVVSRDGGRTWAIDGPVFHVDAADGAEAMTFIQAISPDTVFAWGDGSYLRSTTDAGQHWWRSVFYGTGGICTVQYTAGTLTYGPNCTNGVRYLSADAGRTWHVQQSN
jgi:photosystem II stability/assembly factor-like uncharacterized protein